MLLQAKTEKPYQVDIVESTAGTGAIAHATVLVAPNSASVGTLTAVNTSTNTLTVASAGLYLATGMSVGVANQVALGLFLNGIDLIEESEIRGVCVAAPVYRDRLPYTDAVLEAQFPEIVMVDA